MLSIPRLRLSCLATCLCIRAVQGQAHQDLLPLVFGRRQVHQGMHAVGAVQAELYICKPLEGHTGKRRQYMYVNGRYVQGDAASKLLNTLFQQVMICQI